MFQIRCIQFGNIGKSIRWSSSFNRDRKFYELTVEDEDEHEMRTRPNPLADVEQRIKESKQKLVWRQPPVKQFSLASTFLGLFTTERQRAEHLQKIAQPVPFDISIRRFLELHERRRKLMESLTQTFIPARHEVLGNNLAAAHFLVHRGAAVRFTKSPNWVKKDDDDKYDLPPRFDPDWIIDAIDCDDMELYYEGLENIRRLYELKSFTLKNVEAFDDFCLDRLAGSQFDKLELLDISGTKVTANGLLAILKIPSLKVLIMSDIKRSPIFELTLLMLEDLMPELEVREAENTNQDEKQTPK